MAMSASNYSVTSLPLSTALPMTFCSQKECRDDGAALRNQSCQDQVWMGDRKRHSKGEQSVKIEFKNSTASRGLSVLQPVEWAVAGCLGSLVVVVLVVLRIYLGWAYVGDRLLSAAIPYEETGWYFPT